jgi:DeoR family transcriptional regulator, aga operon transcriptional repressor
VGSPGWGGGTRRFGYRTRRPDDRPASCAPGRGDPRPGGGFRTRGGAISNSTAYDLPLRYNAERNVAEKLRIAEAAAAKAPIGSVVALTEGTTTTEVARAVAVRADLHSTDANAGITVVTNAINIANELAVRKNIKVVVLGGIVRPQSYELTGHLADLTLAAISIDVAIIGGNALSMKAGLTCHHEGEAAIATAIARNAARTIAVTDSTKLGKQAFARICPVQQLDLLVTDSAADPGLVWELQDAGVEVLLV